MIKNFIAEIVHVTKRLKAKDVEVEDRLATSDLNSESINVEKDLTVGNNAVIKKDLTVKGNETVDGNITLGGSVSNKTGTIPFKGNVTVEIDLTVGRNTTIEKDLHVKGSEIIEKDLTVKGATTIKKLTADEIIDNGKVYGSTSEIKELTLDSAKNKNDEGSIAKPARVDHTHKIPVPHKFKIKSYDEKSSTEYDTQSDKELKIDSDFTGSAKKDHKDTSTNYGKGDGTYYGHVKLMDSEDSSKDANSGYAATPKAIAALKTAIEKYLPLSGGTMTGTIVTPLNAVGLKIGGRTEIVDDNNNDSMIIRNTRSDYATKIGIGSDNSTILTAYKGDGTLYLRNRGAGNGSEYGWFYPIQERAIVDYTVEEVITTTKEWTPAKIGNYRIYIVGGGGSGCNAVRFVQTIKDGTDYEKDNKTVYETDAGGNGIVLPGFGGGGGGVVVIDIYVDPEQLPYKISSITETIDGDEVTYDTQEPSVRRAKFTFSSGNISVSGLDSIAGGDFRGDESTTLNVYAGTNATKGKIETVSSNCKWYTENADGTYTINSAYDKVLNNTTSGIRYITGTTNSDDSITPNPILGLAPTSKPAYVPFGSSREWVKYKTLKILDCGDHYHVKISTNKWKTFNWDGIVIPGMPTTDEKVAIEHSGYTKAEIIADYGSIANYINDNLSDLRTNVVEFKYVEYVSSQEDYMSTFVKITNSSCGIGGYATCESYFDYNEYYGGNGDVSQADDIDNDLYDDCNATGYPRRARGYHGGIPGGTKYLGVVGANAASGALKYVVPYAITESGKIKQQKDGVRAGSGASLCLMELGGFCGITDTAIAVNSNTGGSGYYGGGGGGGSAIIFTNSSGGSSVNYTGYSSNGEGRGYGEGGKACVVIAHLGT